MKTKIVCLTLGFMMIASLAFARAGGGEGYNIAQIGPPPAGEAAPWFTGPLLAPSGHTVPAGYFNFEPYVFVTTVTGKYDKDWHAFSKPNFYSVNFQGPLFIGLTDWMDILVVPQASWNGTQGVSSLVVNDFIAQLDFQLIKDTQENNLPGLKVYVQEIFPLGKYQKADPDDLGTDIGGGGSYTTTVGFVVSRLFNVYDDHYLALRLNGFYTVSTPLHVTGVNIYGGAPDTKGKVKPGPAWGGIFAFEYSLTQNWALACDVFAVYSDANPFKGNPGTNADGTPAIVGEPSSFQLSVAPAIEYNVSDSFGFIGGVWLTVAGRNSNRFISGVLAINYFGPWGGKNGKEKPEPAGGSGGR